MSAGETKTFTAELAGGKHAGMAADVLVTVNTVKVKELPELDDDFAQAASEFDTVGELRASTRKQMETMRKAGQAGQARERVLEALIDQVDIPLPERVVQAEIDQRRQNLQAQLDQASVTMQAYLEQSNQTKNQLEASYDTDARKSLKAQFILDKLATDEDLKVTPEELSSYVAEQAYRMGVAPDRLAKQLSEDGRLGMVAADVLRSHALRLLAERARIVDEAGRPVYVKADEPELDAEAPDADEEDAGPED
jgi:trigger factor